MIRDRYRWGGPGREVDEGGGVAHDDEVGELVGHDDDVAGRLDRVAYRGVAQALLVAAPGERDEKRDEDAGNREQLALGGHAAVVTVCGHGGQGSPLARAAGDEAIDLVQGVET